MSTLGNLLWFLLGGLIAGIAWYIVGGILFLTILGIPWARACFVIGSFSFAPFGKAIISRKDLSGKEDIGSGSLGLLGNIIWFVCAGWWLALIHLSAAVLCAITIIGIPFAMQHLKLAAISLSPIGKTVVKKHLAEAARTADAQEKLQQIRGSKLKTVEQPSTEAKYTVARDQTVLGEFARSEIRKNLSTGLLISTDWFWDAVANAWKPLTELQ